MAEDLMQEGTAPFAIPSIDGPCYTYWKAFGNLSSGTAPLVVLHGGPGAAHEYMLPFSKLWSLYSIPVIFYDQIGCASSTHLPQKAGDQSFWQVDLFVAELENLLDHLRLSDGDAGYHLMGHSWGGVVAARFASRRPPGLQRLVLASASADGQLFSKGLWELKKQLSIESQRAIDEAVQMVDFTGQAYMQAQTEFTRMFLCRAERWPPKELAISFKHMAEDSTVRHAVQGPSPWLYTGVLKTWSSIPFASQISAPTLIYNGEFDTTQYEPTVPWFQEISRVRWVTLAHASHMPHLDSAELQGKVLRLVGEFLQQESEAKLKG